MKHVNEASVPTWRVRREDNKAMKTAILLGKQRRKTGILKEDTVSG